MAWEESPNTTLGFPILALERHFTVGRIIIMQTWGILHFWFLPRTDFFLLQLTYLRATCFTLQKAIMVSALSLPQTLTGVEIWMWFFWGRNRHCFKWSLLALAASFSSGTSRKPCQPWICIYSTCSPPISRSNCGRTRAKWRRLPAIRSQLKLTSTDSQCSRAILPGKCHLKSEEKN